MGKIKKPKTDTNSLNLVEKSAQEFFAIVKKNRGAPLGSPGASEVDARYYHFEADLIALVHQHTLQLNHPYVRHYLLSWPKQKDFLRLLHRGLEKAVKRQMALSDVIVLDAVWKGQDKGWSLHRIQESLAQKNLIPHVIPEAFRKRVKKLLSMTGGQWPFYNTAALPKAEDIPTYIREFWDKAEANLRGLLDVPEDRQAIEDYIREKRELREAHFPKKKTLIH